MTFLEGSSSAEIYLSRDFQSDENFLDDGETLIVCLIRGH